MSFLRDRRPWGRGGTRPELPRLKPRQARNDDNVNRVALGELTPDLTSFLGRAACVQLSIFETTASALTTAPTLGGKNAVSRVASSSLRKYDGLVLELVRIGHDPTETMERFTAGIERFQHEVTGGDWYETLVTCYVTAGLLDDFFVRLADGLGDEQRRRITALLGQDASTQYIVEELRRAIADNPRLASRLAMWGRRLVGDTLLVARSSLAVPAPTRSDDARLEPVFTEIISSHTRRMDALGLTA